MHDRKYILLHVSASIATRLYANCYRAYSVHLYFHLYLTVLYIGWQ